MQTKKQMKETRSFWNEAYEWIDCAVVTVIALLLVFTFLFNQVKIDGGSMNDTLLDQDRVIVSNVFYKPKYGDIIVISSEVYDDIPIIKRVIATENQWVDIQEGKVYVGDSKDDMKRVGDEFLNTYNLNKGTAAVMSGGIYGHHQYPLQVPQGCVFVLGDNRDVSLDSRTASVGFVDEDQILGKALYRIYPFDRFGSIY
ncbi:MAG: signal peptidase I [Clostridia bacterium]|nr:signal peptidase I [Clostridia bacterium]